MSLSTEESSAEIRRINDILYRFVGRDSHYSSDATLQFPLLPVCYQVELNESCCKSPYIDHKYHLRLMRKNFSNGIASSVQIVAEIEIEMKFGIVQVFSAGRFRVFNTQDLYSGSVHTNDKKCFIQILLHLLIFCCAAARNTIQFSVQDTPRLDLCEHLVQYRTFGRKYLHPHLHEHVNSDPVGSFYINASYDEHALCDNSVADIKNLARANVDALLQLCAYETSEIFQ